MARMHLALSISALALAAGAALLVPAQQPAVAQAEAAKASADAPFAVDPVHASVVFGIKHMNVANFYGTFDKISGSFLINPADISKSSIDITIDAASVDSNNPGRDDHLKGPDFFSVKEFPTITFKSKSFAKGTGENMFSVTGDLTFRGVTKPVTATLEYTGSGPGRKPGVTLQGFESRFTFKRSDFGNNYMVGKGLSDEVNMIVAIEGSK